MWPIYGHKSNKINGIVLFTLQSLYIYPQEPKKALKLPKFGPPIFPANRAKFYIVQGVLGNKWKKSSRRYQGLSLPYKLTDENGRSYIILLEVRKKPSELL